MTELRDAESQAIALTLREELARRRISRQALADMARISLSTLEKALSGSRPFTLATVVRIEDVLGASLRSRPVAAAAADAVRGYAPKYGLDLRRLVAIGHSAGGHLALWLAARPRLPRDSALWCATPLSIAHVVACGALPDLEQVAASPDNGCGIEVIGNLVGDGNREDRDVYADTSIPRLLPLGVPQDLVNGREDRIVPYRLATGYAAQAGAEATLHTIPDTGHVELVTPDTPAWIAAKRLIAAAF